MSSPGGSQFSVQLANSSVTAFPDEGPAQVSFSVMRSGSMASLNASVAGLPNGASAQVTSPGTGNSGNISISSGSAEAGKYALTLNVTDGSNTVSEPIALIVGVTATVTAASTGTLNEAMSTSFQIAEWTSNFFQAYPGVTTQLGQLGPQHVRIQILSKAIPQTSATAALRYSSFQTAMLRTQKCWR